MVPFHAVGLHGRVAKVLKKATVPVSDDRLAWIRRTRCSLAACWIWAVLICCCRIAVVRVMGLSEAGWAAAGGTLEGARLL